MKKNFSYNGAKLWNELPTKVREKSISCFFLKRSGKYLSTPYLINHYT